MIAMLFVVLTFVPSPGCVLEQATIQFIPPDVARVLLVEQCGSVSCWSRWLDIARRQIGTTRVCDRPSNSDGSPLVVEPTPPRAP